MFGEAKTTRFQSCELPFAIFCFWQLVAFLLLPPFLHNSPSPSSQFEVGRWEGQRSDDYSSSNASSSDPYNPSLPDLDERMVYAIALRAAAQLEAGSFINHMQKASLKEKILDGDETIVRVVVEFVETNDASKLMLVFQRISQSN